MALKPTGLGRSLLEQQRRDGELLRRRLAGSEFSELLHWLAGRFPFFTRFASWGDVLAFMRAQPSGDPACDEILRPLFVALAEDRDPRWREILLAVFWPGLTSIWGKTARWDPDPPDRWQSVLCAFAEAIERVDLGRCPERLVQRVYNGTWNRHHHQCRREWTRSRREEVTDPHDLEDLCPSADMGYARADLRRWQERQIERLREDLRARRITEPEFHLLVGTRIYGRRLRDCAREMGLHYEVAKKRLQRAEARIPPIGRPRVGE